MQSNVNVSVGQGWQKAAVVEAALGMMFGYRLAGGWR